MGSGASSPVLERLTKSAASMQALEWRILRGPKGLPCMAPPWGRMIAIEASTGKQKWAVPFGRFPNPHGSPELPAQWGSASLGGPIVTASGLVFAVGTFDPAMYVFDAESGAELQRIQLPASSRAVPMTFLGQNGRQYVVVAAGGHGIEGLSPATDYLVAFALE